MSRFNAATLGRPKLDAAIPPRAALLPKLVPEGQHTGQHRVAQRQTHSVRRLAKFATQNTLPSG